ncbi:MAG: RidA family protein, partial [Vicinamibacterales bacterium]
MRQGRRARRRLATLLAAAAMGVAAMDARDAGRRDPVDGCVASPGCPGGEVMQDRRSVVVDEVVGPVASPAVVAGGLVFVSAMTAAGPDGRISGDVTAQTTRVFERLARVLAAAGSSLGQTLTIHVYLKHATDFAAMNDAYRQAVGDSPPTRTTVVADLGPDALVAMSAVAVPDGAPREVL